MPRSPRRTVVVADVLASLVVFLVALPLCLGIALASGVPPALGLVTGIVGGLLVGAVQGAPFSVSGPAAGLTVIVVELVRAHGLVFLSTVVLAAGALQIVAGALRLGRWFRAVPPAVVHGMLAGIGVLIVAGQGHVLLGDGASGDGIADLVTLPAALFRALDPSGSPTGAASALIGGLTVMVLAGWSRLAPRRLRAVPAPLAAVAVSTAAANLLGLTVARIEVPRLLSAVTVPGPATVDHLASWTMWVAAIELALVASAETLLCAAAVDRMHSGPRTRYDRELVAQGMGNAVCGLLGALPMTAVIVRSSTNVRAGARSRAATMLHGAWLLMLAVLAAGLLRLVPVPSLSAVLVVVGCRLVDRVALADLRRVGRTEVAVYVITMVGVVTRDLLTGVLAGLAVAAVVLLHRLTHLRIEVEHDADGPRSVLHLHGSATFLRLPKLVEALERIPGDREVYLRLDGLTHVDHAALELIAAWEQAQRRSGRALVVDLRPAGAPGGQAKAAR